MCCLTKFIFWKKNNKKKLLKSKQKLENLEKCKKSISILVLLQVQEKMFIVHYRANKKNCRTLNKKDIFLVTSTI